MKVNRIIEAFEQLAPLCMAEEWDNVGLLVGSRGKVVERIYIALDATDVVISDAIEKKADLLLTHHPLIFKSLKKITDEDFLGNRILQLIQKDITYYTMHTNFDVMVMADLAADYLKLSHREVLEKVEDGHGIGKVGLLPRTMTVEELCQYVKEAFEIPQVKVFGNSEEKVQRVAIMPGSGKSYIKHTINAKAQVMITGDIDHHDGIDAVASGLIVVDAGHYGIEHIFVKYMEEYITKNFEGITVFTEKTKVPFQIV
jgi:dinuclear metal center YbgI/SA1388 family protein